MFTRINLKNFRSFDIIDFDLTEKNNEAKNLAIVYGENGSGKSNLMSSFVLLAELINTMNVRDRYEELLNRTAIFTDEDIKRHIQQQLISDLRDMEAIIDDYRMVGCEEPITVHYEFNIGGSNGVYHIEMGMHELLHERLEFKLNQRKGVYFDCNKESIYINPSIVKDKDLLGDIKSTAKRYWGKHSLLAIVTHEIYDKSEAYGRENLSGNFSDVLYEFELLSCNVGIGDREWRDLNAPIQMLQSPIEGKISVNNEKQIDIVAKIFSKFFSSINSDIKEVVYKKVYNDKHIEYKLCIIRMLADSYRTIDFSKESKGNHQLLRLLCYLLTACFGGIVVLDEADSGIHDLLFKKIIQEICCCIDGQIIMTTHNTMLMESNINKGSIYIISEESGCHKFVRCISDYDKRTYVGNNIRNKYLNNEYNGLPLVERIDFQELINYMAKEIQ